MYILVFTYHDGSRSEYYGGGTFVVNGEKYAVLVSKEKAKRFKSRKVAENSYNKLFESCVNVMGGFRIEEVIE